MKNFITSLVGSAAIALSLTLPTSAREAIIGLSPAQSADALKTQAELVLQHLTQTVEPGESALIFDALNVKLIGTFKVPDKKAYANPRAKLQANQQLLGALKRFIDGAEPVPGRTAQVDAPGFLRSVRENYPSEKTRALILLGSPIFDDPLSANVSMRGGWVPNDGHIVANYGVSPFGTKGLSGSLDGTDIYYGLVGNDHNWANSSEHSHVVERFWTLLSEGHGAYMGYFGDDLGTLFRKASTDTKNVKHSAPVAETDKRYMIHFGPNTARQTEESAAKPTDEPALEPQFSAAENVVIGATWDCARCDLDLYVRPFPAAEPIYFANAKTEQGQMFKDFTRSPSNNGFETVALNGIVDLRQTQVLLNFYGGEALDLPVTGEIKITIGDKVWTAPFEIDAKSGNRGMSREDALEGGVEPNTTWVVIDPLDVLRAR